MSMSEVDKADILWGVEAIAAYIGRNQRQTYYLLQTKQIPGQKVGAIWLARRSRIDAHLSGEGGE